MIYPVKNWKSGFTLIEIIVGLAIMGILSTVVFSIFSFSNNLFLNSNKQHNVQNDVRSGIDIISKKLRYVTDLTIMDVGTSEAQIASHQPYNYIYVKDSTIKMAIYNKTTQLHSTQTIAGVSGIISDAGTSFTKVGESTLGIALAGADGTKDYQASSNIALKNFAILKPTQTIQGTSGPAVRYSENIPSITVVPYTDLVNFEKNMFNIVGPNAGINFGTNNTFNPNGSILMQGTDLTLNGLGNNLNGNIAIKADTLNLGSGQTGTSNGETIFDVKKLTGSLASYNSTFFVHADIFASKPNNANNWNKIEDYNKTFWRYLFAKQGDGNTIPMTVRSLKNDINFTDKSINPTLDISKIHYFSGNSSNKITDSKLPDYKGNISSVANVKSGSYEYIICHGPMIINTTDPNNGTFNFKGIIYCDDIVTFNDMSANFSGIIIAKGLNALNVIGSQNHNWNVSFNNNANSLTEINEILKKITK